MLYESPDHAYTPDCNLAAAAMSGTLLFSISPSILAESTVLLHSGQPKYTLCECIRVHEGVGDHLSSISIAPPSSRIQVPRAAVQHSKAFATTCSSLCRMLMSVIACEECPREACSSTRHPVAGNTPRPEVHRRRPSSRQCATRKEKFLGLAIADRSHARPAPPSCPWPRLLLFSLLLTLMSYSTG